MAVLEKELSAFEKMRDELVAHHEGKWVVFHGSDFINAYDTFETAAAEAVSKFGRGPYLIRQVGAPEFVMPASVAYRLLPQNA